GCTMAYGVGESRVAEAAIAMPDDRCADGDIHAREEVYGSLQRTGNEKKAEDLFPAGDPCYLICKANGELQTGGKLTDRIRDDYITAIRTADLINKEALRDQIQSLQKAYDKALPPDAQAKVARLEQERDSLLLTTSPQIHLALDALQKGLMNATT